MERERKKERESILATGSPSRSKKPPSMARVTIFRLFTLLLLLLILAIFTASFLHLQQYRASQAVPLARRTSSWSGDLRRTQLSWNHLRFSEVSPPPEILKIAVFSRKWPVNSVPGGMERHAWTLYSTLSRRGHRVHVFTSPSVESPPNTDILGPLPEMHFIGDDPSHWRPYEAWSVFKKVNEEEPFDVLHTESVALPHPLAKNIPNLAVSWHGNALEALQSQLVQALVEEPISSSLNFSLSTQPLKVVQEIAFFQNYAHHVSITDAGGEMLRDMYQIPASRVHVIVNGVDEQHFKPDTSLGMAFRREIGVPEDATLVLGIAGRLVRDKGHPLLHRAFTDFVEYPGVFLVVAGTGPWANRYREFGNRALVLGPLSPGKLKAFYNALDVFVNPTLRPQGLDLTLMEAMQCGKPIMATRFPSIKGTLAVEDEFGFLFAPNAENLKEALEMALKEGPRRLAERGRACRRYAASMFTARKMAASYERLFLCIKKESYCKYPLPFDEIPRPA